MNEERLQPKNFEWRSLGTRKGRPRSSWMKEVTTGMREKIINNMEWVNREGWRRKIKH